MSSRKRDIHKKSFYYFNDVIIAFKYIYFLKISLFRFVFCGDSQVYRLLSVELPYMNIYKGIDYDIITISNDTTFISEREF